MTGPCRVRIVGMCAVVASLAAFGSGCGRQAGPAGPAEPAAPGSTAAAGSPVVVTEETFEAEVLEHDGLVLVDFGAAWCPPCRAIEPILENLASEYRGRIKVCKVDIDDEPALADAYKIRAYPTLVMVRGGEVVASEVGARSEADFRSWFDSML